MIIERYGMTLFYSIFFNIAFSSNREFFFDLLDLLKSLAEAVGTNVKGLSLRGDHYLRKIKFSEKTMLTGEEMGQIDSVVPIFAGNTLPYRLMRNKLEIYLATSDNGLGGLLASLDKADRCAESIKKHILRKMLEIHLDVGFSLELPEILRLCMPLPYDSYQYHLHGSNLSDTGSIDGDRYKSEKKSLSQPYDDDEPPETFEELLSKERSGNDCQYYKLEIVGEEESQVVLTRKKKDEMGLSIVSADLSWFKEILEILHALERRDTSSQPRPGENRYLDRNWFDLSQSNDKRKPVKLPQRIVGGMT